MIFLVPIAPIIIAVVMLILAVTIQVASVIEIITPVGLILVIVTSILSIILNILRKDATLGEKIGGIIVSIISSVLSFFVSKAFFGAIVTVDAGNLIGSMEFLFVLVLGGCMWLGSVGMATYASFNMIYDFECDDGLSSIGLLFGSGLLGGIILAATS